MDGLPEHMKLNEMMAMKKGNLKYIYIYIYNYRIYI